MRLRCIAILAFAAVACGTATPAVGTPLTVSQLKFAVIDGVGPPAYCDPDFYPVARAGGEQASALDAVAGEPCFDPAFHAFRSHHRIFPSYCLSL